MEEAIAQALKIAAESSPNLVLLVFGGIWVKKQMSKWFEGTLEKIIEKAVVEARKAAVEEIDKKIQQLKNN